MKLFIWGNVRPEPYGADTLVVWAEDLTQARELALKAWNGGYGTFNGERTSVDVSKLEPDVVITKPDAVYLHWAE